MGDLANMVETIGATIADTIADPGRSFGLTADTAGIATSALAGAAAAGAVAIVLWLYFGRRERSARDIVKHGGALAFACALLAFVVHDVRHAAFDFLGLNSAKPAVEFEIRLPPSAVAALGRDAQIELHTDRNQTIAKLQSTAALADGHAVLRGSVPIEFRTADRLVILNLPGEGQHLFKLRLAANPSRTAIFGPWHVADRVTSQSRPKAVRDDYAIRYRVI
ncbi:acriflavin resistance protein [Rhodopseudomonas telluris]|uniref:Acriflavin resistance protein n=1 Tax=Rhodopseudomonas telluris TaxID=644215 RepID=A0ABV6EW81_9BRAD